MPLGPQNKKQFVGHARARMRPGAQLRRGNLYSYSCNYFVKSRGYFFRSRGGSGAPQQLVIGFGLASVSRRFNERVDFTHVPISSLAWAPLLRAGHAAADAKEQEGECHQSTTQGNRRAFAKRQVRERAHQSGDFDPGMIAAACVRAACSMGVAWASHQGKGGAFACYDGPRWTGFGHMEGWRRGGDFAMGHVRGGNFAFQMVTKFSPRNFFCAVS